MILYQSDVDQYKYNSKNKIHVYLNLYTGRSWLINEHQEKQVLISLICMMFLVFISFWSYPINIIKICLKNKMKCYDSSKKISLLVKRIFWTHVPFVMVNIHYFWYCVIGTTDGKWFALIWSQVIDLSVLKSCIAYGCNSFTVIPEPSYDSFQFKILDLRVTFFWISNFTVFTKTEQYFFNFKLVCITSRYGNFQIKWTNVFYIAAINSVYLKSMISLEEIK